MLLTHFHCHHCSFTITVVTEYFCASMVKCHIMLVDSTGLQVSDIMWYFWIGDLNSVFHASLISAFFFNIYGVGAKGRVYELDLEAKLDRCNSVRTCTNNTQ